MKVTFVDAGNEAAARDMPRARERAPHEALHAVLERGVDEVLALLFFAPGVVCDFLPGDSIGRVHMGASKTVRTES